MRQSSVKYITMFSATTAAAALVSILSAASLTHVEDMNLAVSWSNMRVPKWSHGALLSVQYEDSNHPLIWILNRSGQQSVPFTIPGAQKAIIYDWDRGSDGTIGISGSAVDPEGRAAGFVAWISPGGTNAQVVRTGLYRSAMVAVSPDGTIWTVGTQFAPSGKSQLVQDVGVIQHFDRSGKALGSFVQQSTIRDPLTLSRSRNTLRASKDRIAWYSVDGRYVEISLAGSLLMDVTVDLPGGKPLSESIGFALTDEGDAFLSTLNPNPSGGEASAFNPITIHVLDKSARAWKPVQTSSLAEQPAQNGAGYIYGVDGRKLVLASGKLIKFYNIGN